MFKSIQYKINFYTALLIIVTVGITLSIVYQKLILVLPGIIIFILCFSGLEKCHKRYNQNFNFLLNALDNGDYSFNFSETKLSAREKEINTMMNWIRDILANARKQVIENENFLSIILESASTGIVIVDDNGIVQRTNKAALNMFGFHVFSHLNQLQKINESYPTLFHQLKTGDSIQISLMTEREELKINIKVSQILLKRGMMRILTMNNIGNELESKEMESWIRLIRVMSHEIMNSLAPITSLSETMQYIYRSDTEGLEELKQNTLEAFETINTTAKGLLSFVESYRKFTAIPEPKKKNFILNTLIDKVVKLHKTTLNEKNIELQIQIPESLSVCADENLITQVLINLLKNAIEAIEENSNERIIISTDSYDDGMINLNVANSGKPISAEILPHIFVPFFTTKSSGTGIGLSVSRYIMRLHGGKLIHFVTHEGMTTFQLSIERGQTSGLSELQFLDSE